MKNTKGKDIELLIMANEGDTWNRDFCEYFNLNVTYENWGMGRNGRHEYFNALAKQAKGDWLWHMCDDHYLLPGYEEYILKELEKYNSKDVHCIIPRVDNSGSVSHILSRGWYETTGRIAAHMSVDSYINRVTENMVDNRAILLDQPVLHDFTVNTEIMTPEHTKTEVDPKHIFLGFDSPEITAEIIKDATKLWEAIK
jgi:hypothetical protein